MTGADLTIGRRPPPVPRRVLIGALDWGLGHAARSCVLVQRYLDAGWAVDLASSGPAGRLLRAEFPHLPYYELPAYAVRYPGRNMYRNLARQLPRLLRTGYRENRWLRRYCRRTAPDLIISDSRFGLYHPRHRSVIVTHQTEPILHPAVGGWILPVYRWLLRRFSAVWVPDHAGPDRLSGRLSSPDRYPEAHFIGPLSRMAAFAEYRPAPEWDTLTLLSGPEPQRTYLERELLPQLSRLPGRHLLVRGQPGGAAPTVAGNVEIVAALFGAELARALAGARLVICRSGYSTLLDLRALDKPALLIPTPGQTEQHYLAQRAGARGWATVQAQGSVVVPPPPPELR